MKRSGFLKLNGRDFLKGLIVSIGSAAITVLQTSLSVGEFAIDYKLLMTVSISAGLAYLGKNLFESPQ